MKHYKSLVFCYLIFFISLSLFSQSSSELAVYNQAPGTNLTIKFYPVSMVFNAYNQYNLLAKWLRLNNDYINGRSKTETQWTIPYNGQAINFEFDPAAQISTGSVSSYCYGKYRIDFWWNNNINQPPDDYLIIEFDANHGFFENGSSTDLAIFLRPNPNNGNNPALYYHWPQTNMQSILLPENRYLEGWHQLPNSNYWRNKEYGNFIYDAGSLQTRINNYTIIPQDPRRDCVPEIYPNIIYQNHEFNLSSIGDLTLHLTIEKDIITPDYLSLKPWEYPDIYPTPITIQNGAKLKIAKSTSSVRKITFKKIVGQDLGTQLNVNPNGIIELESSTNSNTRTEINSESHGSFNFSTGSLLKMGEYSQINLNANSAITFYPNSDVQENAFSNIHVHSGCSIYDCGVNITHIFDRRNNFFVIYPGGNYYFNPQHCNTSPGVKTFDYEQEFVLDGGNLTIGDGCSIIFDGDSTNLHVSPGSTIYLGEGASIEFKNGAYLEADGASFTSINSNDIWNGLKFEDAGPSTITNCTFTGAETYLDFTNTTSNNAANSITITGNSFTNGNVKVQNTTNCLISNNVFNSAGLFFNLIDISNTINLQPDLWSLNITGNQFTGGLIQIKLVGLAGNVSPFYVNSNTFNGSASIGL